MEDRVLARFDHGNQLLAREEDGLWTTRLVWGDGAPDHPMKTYSSWNELVLREAEQCLLTSPLWVDQELAAMLKSFEASDGT